VQFACNCNILYAPAIHRNCKTVESQLMTKKRAACWEAFWLGGTRPSCERGTISALMHDCVCDIRIQTCTEYMYLQLCASSVIRVYRTNSYGTCNISTSSPVSSGYGAGEPAHKLET